jgi:hypothetical protein
MVVIDEAMRVAHRVVRALDETDRFVRASRCRLRTSKPNELRRSRES